MEVERKRRLTLKDFDTSGSVLWVTFSFPPHLSSSRAYFMIKFQILSWSSCGADAIGTKEGLLGISIISTWVLQVTRRIQKIIVCNEKSVRLLTAVLDKS